LKLEDIGFYTLSDYRVKQTSSTSPMWRCEVLLTDRCNFKCPYCRGLQYKGDLELEYLKQLIDFWNVPHLKNIRFSGGEPTLHPHLKDIVGYCKKVGVERIAVSTNGSNNIEFYRELVELGADDFSISLDACCSSNGDIMAGVKGIWDRVVDNIREISKLTYVTLGMVFTDYNIERLHEIVTFGHSLGVSDIRIISSAQENKRLAIERIDREIIEKYPILRYRVNHFLGGRNVRGIRDKDAHKCAIVIDDSAVADKHHFPCIIYLREGGKPIGKVGKNMRTERMKWFESHNTFNDSICRNNCLDVCIDYNNRYREFYG